MNRFVTILILVFFFPAVLPAQTPISGIINSYYRVVEVIPAKACVRVDNPAGLSSNDRIMLIQMKGATVSTTNNSSFGSVSAVNNAGNYEVSTVCTIRGDSIFLVFMQLHSYTTTGKVQLVRIPQYEDVVVADTLRAAPWDSASGKGGVLALTVYGNLILNAPLSVNRTGFKGGAYLTSNSTCSNLAAPSGYSYNPSSLAPQSGAYKGESISDPGMSFRGGKGALANGGGGGNNHNNGGGGGSNLGSGGSGGGNSSTSACTTANPGVGGYALSSESGNRIFMGGGGASGHANSGILSLGGGAGGGIMFVQANQVYSNGEKFLAQGQKGGNITSDGAGGGGGGGTIIFAVNSFMDAVYSDASGGDGGNESDDNTAGKCYGEGGGGGGGAVYFNGALPSGTLMANGGAKGLKQHFLSCTPLLATGGTAGSISASYSFRQSSTLSTYCGELILPVQLLDFRVISLTNSADLEWKVADASGISGFAVQRKEGNSSWKDLGVVPFRLYQSSYRYSDKDLKEGVYYYRLKFIYTDGRNQYSSIKKVEVGYGVSRLIVYPNPSSGIIHIIRPQNTSGLLRIFNQNGQLVHSQKIEPGTSPFAQNISNLPTGMYRITMDNYSASIMKK